MTTEKCRRFNYGIDHLVVRPGVLHGWGWVCAEDGPLRAVSVSCVLEDGSAIELPVEYGALRADVGNRLKHLSHAAASGFLVNAAWRGAPLRSARLKATTPSGWAVDIVLIEQNSSASESAPRETGLARMCWQLGVRALRLMRQGQFTVLYEKARRYLAAKPAAVENPPEQLERRLVAAQRGRALLIIDHDLGGGAPLYRQRLIDTHVAQAGVALLLTFHLPTLNYAVQLYGAGAMPRLALPQLDDLLKLARAGWIGDVFFNNAVSFPQPELIPDFLLALRAVSRGRLTLAVHDYYLLCPSHFLLDDAGRFCNLPDLRRCANCLPNNREGFVSFYPARDVVLWRQRWRNLIDAADEVLFFSNSSRQLFLRAYPETVDVKTKVRPHSMAYFPSRKLKVNMAAPLHVGVVGHIGRHKGAKVISGLARAISETRSEIRITIFGSIDEPVDKKIVRVTGSYEVSELPVLIENSGANLIFIPSLVSETFSFVTHEIIKLELLAVCFDLGAQAEAINSYPRGRVIPMLEGEALLNALSAAYEKLRVSMGEVASNGAH